MEDEMKFYQIGTTSEDTWDHLHLLLTQTTILENNIPIRAVECNDEMTWTKTSSVYKLTEEEAEILKNHPLVTYVHLDPASYPEIHKSVKIRYI